MRTIRPRRAAALLAVLALLLAALPAAAAPNRTATNEPGVGVPLLDALTAWLAALWPGTGSPSTPESVWEALGGVLDPDGAPQLASAPAPEPQSISEALGSVLDPGGAPQSASDLPTATAQLGPDADPDG